VRHWRLLFFFVSLGVHRLLFPFFCFFLPVSWCSTRSRIFVSRMFFLSRVLQRNFGSCVYTTDARSRAMLCDTVVCWRFLFVSDDDDALAFTEK